MSKKIIFFLFLSCISLCAISQTFALLDRRWEKPVIISDTITKEYLNQGLYPIYKEDLDTLIILVDKFKNLNKSGLNREFFNADNFKTEHFEFQVSSFKRAYGDSYDITLLSITPFSKTSLKLSDPTKLNPENQKVIRLFLQYLKQAKKDILKPAKKKKNNTKNNPLID
jgi:hypothetical protein